MFDSDGIDDSEVSLNVGSVGISVPLGQDMCMHRKMANISFTDITGGVTVEMVAIWY